MPVVVEEVRIVMIVWIVNDIVCGGGEDVLRFSDTF